MFFSILAAMSMLASQSASENERVAYSGSQPVTSSASYSAKCASQQFSIKIEGENATDTAKLSYAVLAPQNLNAEVVARLREEISFFRSVNEVDISCGTNLGDEKVDFIILRLSGPYIETPNKYNDCVESGNVFDFESGFRSLVIKEDTLIVGNAHPGLCLPPNAFPGNKSVLGVTQQGEQ